MVDKIRKVANELRSHIETRTRETGEQFVTLRDGAPTWCLEVICEANGDMLPDDYFYGLIARAIDAVADGWATAEEHHSWCDKQVDIYNPDRARWLASDPLRDVYCDLAVEEGLVDEDAGIFDRLGAGQYMEAQEIFGLLWHALEKRANEREAAAAREVLDARMPSLNQTADLATRARELIARYEPDPP